MFNKLFVIVSVMGLLTGLVWLDGGIAGEGKNAPAAEALKSLGPSLAKAYTWEPFHPAMPDHL